MVEDQSSNQIESSSYRFRDGATFIKEINDANEKVPYLEAFFQQIQDGFNKNDGSFLKSYLDESPECQEIINTWTEHARKNNPNALDRNVIQILILLIEKLSDSTICLLLEIKENSHLKFIKQIIFGCHDIITNYLRYPMPFIHSLAFKLVRAINYYTPTFTKDILMLFEFKTQLLGKALGMPGLPPSYIVPEGMTPEEFRYVQRNDVRTEYLNLCISFYQNIPISTTSLDKQPLLSRLVKGLNIDTPIFIRNFINTIKEYLLVNSPIHRSMLHQLLDISFFLKCLELFDKNISFPDESELTLSQFVLNFTLEACTDMKYGIRRIDRGYYSIKTDKKNNRSSKKTYNPFLLNLIHHLNPINNTKHKALLLGILETCPELVPHFWSSCNFNFAPRDPNKLISAMALLADLIGFEVPSFKLENPTDDIPNAFTIVDHIIPNNFSKLCQQKSLNDSNGYIRLWAVLLLGKCMNKLEIVIKKIEEYVSYLNESNQNNAQWNTLIKDVVLESKKRFVGFQVIYSIYQNGVMDLSRWDKKEIAMKRALLNIIMFYNKFFVDEVLQSSFEPSKLIPESMNLLELPVKAQFILIELVQTIEGFKWWSTNPSKPSILQRIMMIHFAKQNKKIVNDSFKAIQYLLTTSSPFYQDLDGFQYFYLTLSETLKADNQVDLLRFIDNVFTEYMNNIHYYFDEISKLSQNALESDEPLNSYDLNIIDTKTSISPLLLAIGKVLVKKLKNEPINSQKYPHYFRFFFNYTKNLFIKTKEFKTLHDYFQNICLEIQLLCPTLNKQYSSLLLYMKSHFEDVVPKSNIFSPYKYKGKEIMDAEAAKAYISSLSESNFKQFINSFDFPLSFILTFPENADKIKNQLYNLLTSKYDFTEVGYLFTLERVNIWTKNKITTSAIIEFLLSCPFNLLPFLIDPLSFSNDVIPNIYLRLLSTSSPYRIHPSYNHLITMLSSLISSPAMSDDLVIAENNLMFLINHHLSKKFNNLSNEEDPKVFEANLIALIGNVFIKQLFLKPNPLSLNLTKDLIFSLSLHHNQHWKLSKGISKALSYYQNVLIENITHSFLSSSLVKVPIQILTDLLLILPRELIENIFDAIKNAPLSILDSNQELRFLLIALLKYGTTSERHLPWIIEIYSKLADNQITDILLLALKKQIPILTIFNAFVNRSMNSKLDHEDLCLDVKKQIHTDYSKLETSQIMYILTKSDNYTSNSLELLANLLLLNTHNLAIFTEAILYHHFKPLYKLDPSNAIWPIQIFQVYAWCYEASNRKRLHIEDKFKYSKNEALSAIAEILVPFLFKVKEGLTRDIFYLYIPKIDDKLASDVANMNFENQKNNMYYPLLYRLLLENFNVIGETFDLNKILGINIECFDKLDAKFYLQEIYKFLNELHHRIYNLFNSENIITYLFDCSFYCLENRIIELEYIVKLFELFSEENIKSSKIHAERIIHKIFDIMTDPTTIKREPFFNILVRYLYSLNKHFFESILIDKNIPKLTSVYNATCSEADIKILDMLKTYELKVGKSIRSYCLTFGNHALANQQNNLKLMILNGTISNESFSLIDKDKVLRTILNFSISETSFALCESYPNDMEIDIYDISYLLCLIGNLLLIGSDMCIQKLCYKNLLGFLIRCTSSNIPEFRMIAFRLLDEVFALMWSLKFEGKLEIHYLLSILKNSIIERDENTHIPVYISIFCALAIEHLLNAKSPIFQSLCQFIATQTHFELDEVPGFEFFFNMSSSKSKQEKLWMLQVLSYSIESNSDLVPLKKHSYIEKVLDYLILLKDFDKLKDFKNEFILIMRLLFQLSKFPELNSFMVDDLQIFLYLNSIISDTENKFKSIHPYADLIILRLVYQYFYQNRKCKTVLNSSICLPTFYLMIKQCFEKLTNTSDHILILGTLEISLSLFNLIYEMVKEFNWFNSFIITKLNWTINYFNKNTTFFNQLFKDFNICEDKDFKINFDKEYVTFEHLYNSIDNFNDSKEQLYYSIHLLGVQLVKKLRKDHLKEELNDLASYFYKTINLIGAIYFQK